LRRLWWLLVPLAAAGAVWLYGRAPTDYVLLKECRRFQEERVERLREIDFEIAAGKDPQRAKTLLEERITLRNRHRRMELRGWEVILIPAGALRPEPRDFYRAGKFDPAERDHPPELQGEWEAWYAPRSAVPKLLADLGLAP